MRKLRILHAPAIITHQQWTISRAQRQLGHKSDVMTFNANMPNLLFRKCDINLNFNRNHMGFSPSKIVPTAWFVLRFAVFFIIALFKYDVFHFHSESFLGSHSDLDLRILRFFRKKIVFQYWGCDIRLKTMSLLDEAASTCRNCIRACQNTRKYRDMINHLKFADFRVYGGADCSRFVPDALFLQIGIDLNNWLPADEIPIEHRLKSVAVDTIRILQPFENKDARGDQKGVRFAKAAAEALKREGRKIDYIVLDGVPLEAMKYYYQQADIVIDQFTTGWHGNVSVEAMAMSRPVLCYLSDEALRLLPEGNPIVNTPADRVKEKLSELIEDRKLRQDIGRQGRNYIEKYYDSLKVAKEWISLYNANHR